MLLMNGKLELASYCVCHAAELNATLGLMEWIVGWSV